MRARVSFFESGGALGLGVLVLFFNASCRLSTDEEEDDEEAVFVLGPREGQSLIVLTVNVAFFRVKAFLVLERER